VRFEAANGPRSRSEWLSRWPRVRGRPYTRGGMTSRWRCAYHRGDEAEGAILCFIIFLVPGLPKDTLCYLFGVSPIPFWVFAVVSTLVRMPGTWMLSAGGAKAAAAQYADLLLLIAVLAAVVIPLYYYRSRIRLWLRRRATL
jgi:uncharacterized membrane protein YdjX (TVP38/TMEM64 family)